MSLSELQSLLDELCAQRSELKAIIAQCRADWLNEKKHTPLHIRAEMDAEIASIRAEIATTEAQMKQLKDAEKQVMELDFWHWSDQMLAAVTYLLEVEGRGDIVKSAKKMVSDGWPKKKQTT